MKDLYNAIDALNNIVNENKQLLNEKDGDGIKNAPKVPSYKSLGDMVSAIKLPGKQGVADPNQSRANIQKAQAAQAKPQPAAPKPKLGGTGAGRQDGPGLPKPAAPKINPAVPAAGPVRKNPINPQAQAVAKAATSVASAPKQAAQAPTPAAVPVPKPKPAEPVAAPKPQGGDRVTYQSLAKASGIADPNKIKPGQEIKLPGGGTYKVQSGDTLSGIAQNVRLGKVGTPKPATKPAPDRTNRATSQGGRTAQQAADTYAGGNVQGGEFGTGPVSGTTSTTTATSRTASTTSATPRKVSTVAPGRSGRNAARGARNAATTGSVQGGAPAQPGPSVSDVTAAGNARFGDPMQKARDKRDAAQAAQAEPTQTKPVGSMLDRITGGISGLFGGGKDKAPTSTTGPNAAGSNFATAADGSISRTDNPRQPDDDFDFDAPTLRAEPLDISGPQRGAKGRIARNMARQRANVATARTQARDIASGAATAPVARDSGPEFAPVRGNTTPERGTVPGQTPRSGDAPATRTVTRGGQQVTGADADAATAQLKQAENLAKAQRMFGPGKTAAEYNALIKQQNAQNAAQLDRLDKAGKLPNINIDDL